MPPDSFRIIRAMVRHIFAIRGMDASTKDSLVAFAQQLERDYRRKRLPQTLSFHGQLLECYLRLGAHDELETHWDWLSLQDASLRTPFVWGIMFRHRHATGAGSLVLQNMFEQVLQESGDRFIAYRFSENALLSDRARVEAHALGFSDMLSAIAQRQIQDGKVRNAYLTIDTLVREFPQFRSDILPGQLLQSQPITEAYRLLVLGYRLGGIVPPAAVYRVIAKAKTWRQGSYEYWFTDSYLANLDITIARVGFKRSGDSALVTLFQSLESTVREVLDSDAGPVEENMNLLIEALKLAFDVARTIDHNPRDFKLYGLLESAGYMQSGELYDFLLQSSQPGAFLCDRTSCVAVMRAAGYMGDGPMLKAAWLAALQQPDFVVDSRRCFLFIMLARLCGIEDFATEEIDLYFGERESDLTPEIQSEIKNAFGLSLENANALRRKPMYSSVAPASPILDLRAVLGRFKKFAMTLKERKLRNFFEDPLPDSLAGDRILSTEENWLKVYDRLTRDPREPLRKRDLPLDHQTQSARLALRKGSGEKTQDGQSSARPVIEDDLPANDNTAKSKNTVENKMDHTTQDNSNSKRALGSEKKVSKNSSVSKYSASHGRLSGVAITQGGYRIDDLRYANWRDMNELILEGCYSNNYDLGEEGVMLESRELLSEEQLLRVVMKVRGIDPAQLPKHDKSRPTPVFKRAAFSRGPLFHESINLPGRDGAPGGARRQVRVDQEPQEVKGFVGTPSP